MRLYSGHHGCIYGVYGVLYTPLERCHGSRAPEVLCGNNVYDIIARTFDASAPHREIYS